MRTHRDLPPGSQGWASDVDRMEQRIKDLESLVTRLSTMLRVDPTRPDLNVNPQTIAPAVNSADQQKLSGLADTSTYNVADQQALVWDQKQQAWVPKDLGGTPDFTPDQRFIAPELNFNRIAQFTAHGDQGATAQVENTIPYAWWSWSPQDGSIAGQASDRTNKVTIAAGSTHGGGKEVAGAYAELSVTEIASGRKGGIFAHLDGTALMGLYTNLPTCTTATRPTGGVGPEGRVRVVWDSTIKKLIFSPTGLTPWYDALGNTV